MRRPESQQEVVMGNVLHGRFLSHLTDGNTWVRAATHAMSVSNKTARIPARFSGDPFSHLCPILLCRCPGHRLVLTSPLTLHRYYFSSMATESADHEKQFRHTSIDSAELHGSDGGKHGKQLQSSGLVGFYELLTHCLFSSRTYFRKSG